MQIQRHTEISNTIVANTKTHRYTKYNCCKCQDTTKYTHKQFSTLFENIKQQELQRPRECSITSLQQITTPNIFILIYFSPKDLALSENDINNEIAELGDYQVEYPELSEPKYSPEDVRRIGQFFRLLRIVKLFRIIRIFKLARHVGALKALGKTSRKHGMDIFYIVDFIPRSARSLQYNIFHLTMEIFLVTTSYRELGTLFLFLFMGVLIFSSLVYVFENDNLDSSFATMLDAYW